jgi:hypothetical protein
MNLFENRLIALARAGEQQRRDEAEQRAAQAARVPPPEPAPALWNGMTGLERMVRSLRAQETAEAESRRPQLAPPQETQSQIIDANYAKQLGKRLLGANAQAIAQCESRKAVAQMKENQNVND